MGAALNGGILVLSQIAQTWHITPESWRWLFTLAAAPAGIGLLVVLGLPESPLWLAARELRWKARSDQANSSTNGASVSGQAGRKSGGGILRQLFRPPLLRPTVVGIALGSIPMIGAWAASKWMIPWADKVAGSSTPGYKAATQGWWALGAVLGSFFGAQIAARLGRRLAYAIISAGASGLTLLMFLGTAPLRASFLPVVFAQGCVATLFFGWLPLYLPELFPTHVRAAGSGISYNVGRFATALGVLIAGALFAAMGGSYPKVGATCGLVYLLGVVAIWWAPDTTDTKLEG
jgi:MFS family permease